MDLYSAAKRLGRPFRFDESSHGRELPLDARAMIGDGLTGALVRIDGAIDWLCLPRFDSPSVFGAALDPRRGGLTAITPVHKRYESLQRYDPDTNVLETMFRIEGHGVARLVDYMPWSDDPRAAIHEVHRRIDCLEGSVELEVIFDPRFDYGREPMRLEIEEHGVIARAASGEALVAVLNDPAPWSVAEEGGLRARLTLHAGVRRWMVLSWDAVGPQPFSAYRPFEHLRSTRQHWREWSRSLTYEGPWRHHVQRAALALKLMSYAPTGAMVAAPTTSFPEWLGGPRNWDYRYVWSRDAAMAIRATNLIGYEHEARDFFHFIRDALDRTRGLQIMYAVDGATVPDEIELENWSGAFGSHPVRVGNAAKDQLQLDTSGALLDAAYHYERFGGHLPLRTWRHLKTVARDACRNWREPDHGIWEPRSGMRHNVHSKVMCWLALHRGQQLSWHFGDHAARLAWEREAEVIKADILANGLDPTGSHFVKAYGGNEPDAALLLIPTSGFLPPTDPRVLATIDWLRTELSDGPFLHRYKDPDGVRGPEGAFLLAGFWLAEALALAGRVSEAQEVFVNHAEASNHIGLLSEEIDAKTRTQLGNFPQAFSHLGLINAALRIDLALRQRDEGIHRPPRLMGREPLAD